MNFSVGIIGLPNVGKSTLFKALTQQEVDISNYPFCTIDPNVGIVRVPDERLNKISQIVKPQKTTPTIIEFVDIAGLVKGAHKGEGLGNQFLSYIREVDAIVHVVRAFSDPVVTHQHASHEPGSIEQILEDIEIVNIELELGGISKKPTIYVLNSDEDDLKNMELIKKVEEKFKEKALLISAKMEEDLID